MITETKIIRPINAQSFAIRDALRSYGRWKKRNWLGAIYFVIDLCDYLLRGFVVARPTCFAMAKIIDLAPEGAPKDFAWYIRFATGDLYELLGTLPGYLPKIAFCRHFDRRLRVYDFNQLFSKLKTRK